LLLIIFKPKFAIYNLKSKNFSERFFAVESLGESVDCIGVIVAVVIVEEHIFLRFITLGFPNDELAGKRQH